MYNSHRSMGPLDESLGLSRNHYHILPMQRLWLQTRCKRLEHSRDRSQAATRLDPELNLVVIGIHHKPSHLLWNMTVSACVQSMRLLSSSLECVWGRYATHRQDRPSTTNDNGPMIMLYTEGQSSEMEPLSSQVVRPIWLVSFLPYDTGVIAYSFQLLLCPNTSTKMRCELRCWVSSSNNATSVPGVQAFLPFYFFLISFTASPCRIAA